MDKRILKTFAVIFLCTISALIIPVFGQWYYQQTGIMPVGFYAVAGFGGLIGAILSLLRIWGEIKSE